MKKQRVARPAGAGAARSKRAKRDGTRPGAGAANRRGADKNMVPPAASSVDVPELPPGTYRDLGGSIISDGTQKSDSKISADGTQKSPGDTFAEMWDQVGGVQGLLYGDPDPVPGSHPDRPAGPIVSPEFPRDDRLFEFGTPATAADGSHLSAVLPVSESGRYVLPDGSTTRDLGRAVAARDTAGLPPLKRPRRRRVGPATSFVAMQFTFVDSHLGLLIKPVGGEPRFATTADMELFAKALRGAPLPVYGSREVEDPLPRCKHGNNLRDGAGEALQPDCGCRWVRL